MPYFTAGLQYTIFYNNYFGTGEDNIMPCSIPGDTVVGHSKMLNVILLL
jgi:hypothetical protein